jgi:hypothetical protein
MYVSKFIRFDHQLSWATAVEPTLWPMVIADDGCRSRMAARSRLATTVGHGGWFF